MNEEQDLFSSNIDYKKILFRFLSYRRLYIIVIILSILITYLVNRFSQVKYQNSTVIYLNINESNSLLPSTNDIAASLGMFNVQNNIDNELEILKSFTLIKEVINGLDLKVSYFSTRNNMMAGLLVNTPFVQKTELYKDSPIRVVVDPSLPQAVNMNFKVTFMNENEFIIEATGSQIPLYNYIDDNIVSTIPEILFNQRFRFGDEIKTQYFNFRIQKESSFSKDFTQNNNLYFKLNNINDLTLAYQGRITTQSTSQTSTLLKATLKGTNRQAITDFLNFLSTAYLDRNMEKKNRMAMSTVSFIDSQISDVADSLSYAEATLENFRTSEGVMDLSFQSQQVFEQLSRLEDQKANLELQKKYYEYLQNYLSTNSDVSDLMGPSAGDIIDPIITQLITTLISLNDERATLLRNSTSQQNLYLEEVNLRIDQAKRTIRETVDNTLNTIKISLNEVNYRISRSNSQISQMPKTELQLKGIERKFTINDAIYTFLLQKRSEAQIARASTMPDMEVVDPAILAMAKRVSPKTKLNYIIGLLLALLLPSFVIVLKDFLNNKITDADEIEKMVQFPILGRVFHNFHKSRLVVSTHPNSSVTECFRALRTNFQFFSEGGKKQIILITSTSSGEGKTFTAMNLASVFALNGNRTVLLEFDLRRPKIYQEFTTNNMIGISSFLIDKAVIEDIILPTQVENMDFIPAGPAAPNPAELINSERTAELIDKLKEMYDFIIIDSPPAGILTETYILMKYADLNVYIVRLNKTVKEGFRQTMKTLANNKLINISLIINDLYANKESYKYGYDKKYYTDDNNRNLFTRIFSRKRKAS